MKLATLTITAFTVLGTAAFAGGNPEDEQNGYMTRERLEAPAPMVPDQHEIQRQVEAEIFAKPQIKPEPLKTEVREEPVIIARAEPKSECWTPFSWLAEQLGGECYRDSNFHNPSPIGRSFMETEIDTRDRVFEKDFEKKFKGRYGKKRAQRFAAYKERLLSRIEQQIEKSGDYDLEYEVTVNGRKVTVQVTLDKLGTRTVLTQIRNDARDNDSYGGTANDSNGMRGDSRDSGNW